MGALSAHLGRGEPGPASPGAAGGGEPPSERQEPPRGLPRGEAAHVVSLPGDGVGPEVTGVALGVLSTVCAEAGIDLQVEERLVGGRAIDETGVPLPAPTLDACRGADAVLLGAVGGPKWDHLRGALRCEAGLLGLRRGMGVFANLRPVRVHPRLVERTTIRPEVVRGTDMVIVRELTGGAYFGEPRERSGSGPEEIARDSTVYTAAEIERVARIAFDLAAGRRRHLTSVDKANVLITSQLWRDTVTRLAAEYPAVTLEHQLVDSFAMRLVQRPAGVDVVVTENLFGDILSDEAGVLAGSLGMLPSASLGDGGAGLYEPIHGSAPDIAGRGIANPYGAILSIALLLRHSLRRDDLALAVEAAVDDCITGGTLSADLGGSMGTEAIGAAVRQSVVRHLAAAGSPR
jgi:3-isopropylmalate dehydrogenase